MNNVLLKYFIFIYSDLVSLYFIFFNCGENIDVIFIIKLILNFFKYIKIFKKY